MPALCYFGILCPLEDSPALPDYPSTDTPNSLRFAALYSDLRQLAERQLRRNAGAPISPTTLLHEAYLEHLQLQGVRVLNGAKAFRYEISKAGQASLLKSLGLRFLPSRVIHSPHQAVAAAEGLRYPIIVKANTGGSGKGITRFNAKAELAAAVAAGQLDLGNDSVALVQEFIPARGGFITRVETLGFKYLYAIKVHLTGETFDLCPADICQTSSGQSLENACAVEASKAGLKVEGYEAPPKVIQDIERIVRAAGIDVGGIEYIVDDRDGNIYYYDVNALSNFVADAPRVIGFNPVENLADFLQDEVRRAG